MCQGAGTAENAGRAAELSEVALAAMAAMAAMVGLSALVAAGVEIDQPKFTSTLVEAPEGRANEAPNRS